jgi:hypothetical protein
VADDPEAKRSRNLYREAIQTDIERATAAPKPTAYTVATGLPSVVDEGRRNIKNRTALMILELASHTLVLGLALGSLWLIHLILEALLGKDAKFFSFVPISWIIDAADLLIIGKFLWEIIKDFRRD